MKNNRLTNSEVYDLRKISERIKELSRMETCAFRNQEMIEIGRLKSWLMWFEVEANKIDEIINAE